MPWIGGPTTVIVSGLPSTSESLARTLTDCEPSSATVAASLTAFGASLTAAIVDRYLTGRGAALAVG